MVDEVVDLAELAPLRGIAGDMHGRRTATRLIVSTLVSSPPSRLDVGPNSPSAEITYSVEPPSATAAQRAAPAADPPPPRSRQLRGNRLPRQRAEGRRPIPSPRRRPACRAHRKRRLRRRRSRPTGSPPPGTGYGCGPRWLQAHV